MAAIIEVHVTCSLPCLTRHKVSSCLKFFFLLRNILDLLLWSTPYTRNSKPRQVSIRVLVCLLTAEVEAPHLSGVQQRFSKKIVFHTAWRLKIKWGRSQGDSPMPSHRAGRGKQELAGAAALRADGWPAQKITVTAVRLDEPYGQQWQRSACRPVPSQGILIIVNSRYWNKYISRSFDEKGWNPAQPAFPKPEWRREDSQTRLRSWHRLQDHLLELREFYRFEGFHQQERSILSFHSLDAFKCLFPFLVGKVLSFSLKKKASLQHKCLLRAWLAMSFSILYAMELLFDNVVIHFICFYSQAFLTQRARTAGCCRNCHCNPISSCIRWAPCFGWLAKPELEKRPPASPPSTRDIGLIISRLCG